MYGCESWTIKKAEHQRIDNFELWHWRRLLRLPWTARRSNQSILKEVNPEHSLEGLMLKLKLQYLGHLIQRANSLEKTLMPGKIEGKRRELQRIRWLDNITDTTDMNLRKLWEIVEDRGAWCTAVQEVSKSQTCPCVLLLTIITPLAIILHATGPLQDLNLQPFMLMQLMPEK